MTKVKDEDLDSCGKHSLQFDLNSLKKKGIGNILHNIPIYKTPENLLIAGKSLVRNKWSEQAEETMGDYLCGQVAVKFYSSKKSPLDNKDKST